MSKEIKKVHLCCAGSRAVINTFFKKRANRLITYSYKGSNCKTNNVLVKSSNLKLVQDVNVIPGKECITQQKTLVVADIALKAINP